MQWLGQIFPVLMLVLAAYYTWMSFYNHTIGGGMYAIAAAILLGVVLIAARLGPSRESDDA